MTFHLLIGTGSIFGVKIKKNFPPKNSFHFRFRVFGAQIIDAFQVEMGGNFRLNRSEIMEWRLRVILLLLYLLSFSSHSQIIPAPFCFQHFVTSSSSPHQKPSIFNIKGSGFVRWSDLFIFIDSLKDQTWNHSVCLCFTERRRGLVDLLLFISAKFGVKISASEMATGWMDEMMTIS